jgi:hypothetical protein
MLLQLLTCWKNALANPSTKVKEQPVDGVRLNTRMFVEVGLKKNEATNQKIEPVSSVFHLVEGFALVMLCNCRLYPRRLAVHILREIKLLLKTFGNFFSLIFFNISLIFLLNILMFKLLQIFRLNYKCKLVLHL